VGWKNPDCFDRDENIRRIGFVCELLSRNGVIAIVAAISPYREVRRSVLANAHARALLGWQPRNPLERGIAATLEWMRTVIT